MYLTAWYSALPVDARLSSLSRCSLVLISRVSTSPSKRGKSFRRSMRFGFLLSPWSIHSRALMEGLSDGVNGYKSRWSTLDCCKNKIHKKTFWINLTISYFITHKGHGLMKLHYRLQLHKCILMIYDKYLRISNKSILKSIKRNQNNMKRKAWWRK